MVDKKMVFKLLLMGLLISNVSFAQVVTVEGFGVDKDSAVRDAMRNAVEQVVGTFVDSRTLVDKSVVAMDEIYTKSQGYVKDVKVVSENKSDNGYHIRANIDVDTNPKSELLSKIAMIVALNDPRISVYVDYYTNYDGNDQKDKYPQICEATMNNKLVQLGFNHVVSSLEIRGKGNSLNFDKSVTDYVVVGKLDINSKAISLPKFETLTTQKNYNTDVYTGLVKATSELDVKVIKTDTKEVIGNFRVESDGIKDSVNNSENEVVKNVAVKAAEQLRKVFAQKAANVSSNLQVVVRTDAYNKVANVEDALRGISGVRSVMIRNYENGKATIDVDSDLKPQVIFRMLKEKVNVFLEQYSANNVEVSI